MRMKPKKRPRAMTAVNLSIGGALLLLWLVCAFCLTFSVAQNLFDIFLDEATGFTEYAGHWMDYRYDENLPESEARTPGYLENGMLESLNNTDSYGWYNSDWLYEEDGWGISLLRDTRIPIQTAIIFEDMDGNVIHTNKDFLSFGYVTQETYEREGPDTSWDGYAWVDLGDPEDPRYQILRSDYSSTGSLWHDYRYVRFTGTMDGSRMDPVEMSVISYDDWAVAIEQAGSTKAYTDEHGVLTQEYDYSFEELDAMGLLKWTTHFDNTASAGDRELVTIYTTSLDMSVYDPGGPVGSWKNSEYWSRYKQNHTALGQTDPEEMEYANLQELLDTMRRACSSGSWGNVCYWQKRMDDLIVLDKRTYRMDYEAEEPHELDFKMYTAFRVSPLSAAASLLRNVYIATFALFLLCFLILRAQIKRHMILPVQLVNEGIDGGWANIHEYREDPPAWQEPYALYQNYNDTQSTLRMRQNEINRLSTALTYAKNAEQNRRQMVSHIAHEFKTPLAIIHGYAEGLKERINEDKRDKYTDVILAETEHLDDMVLELLDLSRLEAGKVKLALDTVSLAELTRAVFERLDMAVQAKELKVTFDFPEERTVQADEARIKQVIENFVSNAVKYTPVGGNIRVRIGATPYRTRSETSTTFSIENDSAPFSQEALNKVWETFYRTDSARSGGGTGLGLAIAKQIIELHGGNCAAYNTKTGVEFRFTLH